VIGDDSRYIFAKTISRHFDIYVYRLPADLPPVIDEDVPLPLELFDSNVILSYAFHPNVNADIVRMAEEFGVKVVLIAGNYGFLRKIGRTRVLVGDVCCSKIVKGCEFFEKFGIPEFEVRVDEDYRLEEIRVVRSAPCGATYYVAERLKGETIEEAPTKAGLYTQLYPCLASRGVRGGIHKAGNIHKLAMERAIRRALR